MKFLMTILSLVTISTAVWAANNQSRCDKYVEQAALAKVKASLIKSGVDPQNLKLEVKNQTLVITNPEFEAWFVATVVQTDQTKQKERQEIIQFDKNCQPSMELAWPQTNQ